MQLYAKQSIGWSALFCKGLEAFLRKVRSHRKSHFPVFETGLFNHSSTSPTFIDCASRIRFLAAPHRLESVPTRNESPYQSQAAPASHDKAETTAQARLVEDSQVQHREPFDFLTLLCASTAGWWRRAGFERVSTLSCLKLGFLVFGIRRAG